jgi:hypothetical protein
MGINAFERRLERMVDGVFARAFRSSLRPIEIGRKLVREIDDHRSVDVKGRIIVPNQFTVSLAKSDLEQFSEIHDALVHELCDAAREYARDEGYTFMGPVSVELVEMVTMKTGRFKVGGRWSRRRRSRAASCCRPAIASSSARRPSPSAACRAATSPFPTPT